MSRFSEYAKNNDKIEQENFEFIYDEFKKTLLEIFESNKYGLSKLLNLLAGFMDFSVNFYKNEITKINEILSIATQLCKNAPKEELVSE